MESLKAIVAAARANSGARSERHFARLLGIKSSSSIARWESGEDLPSDATMLRLCEMARIDPQPVLLELNEARAIEPVRSVYSDLRRTLARAAVPAIALAAAFSVHGQAVAANVTEHALALLRPLC